jgi:hypothetical protein
MMTDSCAQTPKYVLTDRQIDRRQQRTHSATVEGLLEPEFPAVGKCDQTIRLIAMAEDRSSKPEGASTFLAGQVPDNTGLYHSAGHSYDFIISLSEHTV